MAAHPPALELDRRRCAFYRTVLALLTERGTDFVVGGAHALEHYTGVARTTKDLDMFIRRADCARILEWCAEAGYATELTLSHWLAKIHSDELLIDVIFNSGNGLCGVDDDWFRHARPGQLLGLPVRFAPPEEMIWSKAFIMERERYDGADIAHLLHRCTLDWPRLLRRFGEHWHVLLSHLVLFQFIFPDRRGQIPVDVMRELCRNVEREQDAAPTAEGLCHGTLLSLRQYRSDLEGGYGDARLHPHGTMTPDEIARWTSAFPR